MCAPDVHNILIYAEQGVKTQFQPVGNGNELACLTNKTAYDFMNNENGF